MDTLVQKEKDLESRAQEIANSPETVDIERSKAFANELRELKEEVEQLRSEVRKSRQEMLSSLRLLSQAFSSIAPPDSL